MEDVADVAGVSRGTVSRVLNGGHYVSPDALAAVHRAIRKTGYVVNQHARSLVTQRSDSVAFILSDPQDRLFEDPNFAILLKGCTQALAERGITLVLTIAGTLEDRKRVGRWVTAGHVDGVLLVSEHAGSPLIDELRARGLPIVAAGRPIGYERDISYVAADDRDGARQMVTYLRSRGHQRIGIITGPIDTPGGVDRLAGYHDVLGDGDPRLVANGDYTQDSGGRAMEELLLRAPDLDAVFVCSDLMARGAIAALRRAGEADPRGCRGRRLRRLQGRGRRAAAADHDPAGLRPGQHRDGPPAPRRHHLRRPRRRHPAHRTRGPRLRLTRKLCTFTVSCERGLAMMRNISFHRGKSPGVADCARSR